MMFKRLVILGVLAVCLFALVMGGCNRDDPPPDKPIEIVTPPVELTPMEKLAGSYWLVRHTGLWDDGQVQDPVASGRLELGSGGSNWSKAYDNHEWGGTEWSATSTTITFAGREGAVPNTQTYTLVGKILTISEYSFGLTTTEIWQKH